MTTIEVMKQDILSHQKHMTNEILDQMEPLVLLRNTHPLYRSSYASELKSEGILNTEQAKEFVK